MIASFGELARAHSSVMRYGWALLAAEQQVAHGDGKLPRKLRRIVRELFNAATQDGQISYPAAQAYIRRIQLPIEDDEIVPVRALGGRRWWTLLGACSRPSGRPL